MDVSTPSIHPFRDPAPKDPSEAILAFSRVFLSFDGPLVLENISFSVAPNETRILLGPAGVGKSVLLKLCNGLLRPTEGRVVLFGEDISHLREEMLFPLRMRTGMPVRMRSGKSISSRRWEMSSPKRTTRPSVGRSRPLHSLRSTLLPTPAGPSRIRVSFGATENEMFSRTSGPSKDRKTRENARIASEGSLGAGS